MVIKLIVEYDGTTYNGWQSQPNGNTIQQKIEYALKQITNQEISVTGSGRTDSGVHAKGQVASFVTDSSIVPEKFARAINTFLPDDIRIISSSMEKDDFNARFSSKRKTYKYSMYISNVEHPLLSRYKVMISKVDLEKMQKACSLLIGEKDFSCFLASKSSVKNGVRTIYNAEIISNGTNLDFFITGNGFLYNMVRIIVGTLLDIGYGKTEIQEFKSILESKKRPLAGRTMPSKGLTLWKVEY